ncbi:MAG: pilin [Patescibacteria group bacterium]|jgi:amino acid transporter
MKKYFYLLTILGLLILPSFVSLSAQDIGLQGGQNPFLDQIADRAGFNTDSTVKGDAFLETTLGQLIAIFLGFLGTLFVVLIIYSGIQWMSAGGEEEKVTEAKQRIKNAIFGLLLVLFSYIISNLVFTFLSKQRGEPAVNPLNECQTNIDCPTLRPICEDFNTQKGQAKLCTCYYGQEPACPAGTRCSDRPVLGLFDLDLRSAHACEPY